MSGTAPSSSPRRKRSLSSMAAAAADDDQDLADTRLKRAPIAEENLEAKARKRQAREQKAKYAALGSEPPPTMSNGRRRWEYIIRFQQHKLQSGGNDVQPQAGAVPVELPDYSPEGFSTSTWRIGDVVRQVAAASAKATGNYYGEVKPLRQQQQQQNGAWPASSSSASVPLPDCGQQQQASALWSGIPPIRRLSGQAVAYSPYPMTPPMDDFQPNGRSPIQRGSDGLGLYGADQPWMLPPTATNAGSSPLPIPTSTEFSSWQSQRTVTVHRAPKPYPHAVSARPSPLPFIPPMTFQHPYPPSPQMAAVRQFGGAFPPAVATQPPPVPLYAPNPTRPARTCSFIRQVNASPPQQHSAAMGGNDCAGDQPRRDSETSNGSGWSLPPPPVAPSGPAPSLILSPPDDPQQSLQPIPGSLSAPQNSPAVAAPPMLPSTSWTGSLYTPVMRTVASFQGSDSWPTTSSGGHAHSTPDLYSQERW
ncbi:hypothetical protein JCM10908_006173 [Rhodotorula pacifica]|uniref:uncharacterized protein n=1 Tax=Rhodotorula pacifica TaxID=1495444 RepID=UPI00317143CB